MRLLLEIIVAVFFHPVAFVLAAIDIVGRNDLTGLQKVLWAVVSFVWGIGPILYVYAGGGRLW